MKAVQISETGGLDVLRLVDLPRPDPQDGEVLIEVRSASINPVDWKQRRGLVERKLPSVLGRDVSGTVALSRAEGFAIGDEVFGVATSGGYATFATAAVIAKKPAGISHDEAAAIPIAGMTAWQALFDRGGLQSGQTVAIAGAAGGVGHLAVQFARVARAHVIGIGSSRNREFVLGLGADEYVDYTRQDLREALHDVDVAFDTVGGDTTHALLDGVRKGGVLVTIASAPPEDGARQHGVRTERLFMAPAAELLTRIAEHVAAGDVRVEITARFALADVLGAHERSEAGHTRGKMVLTIDPADIYC